MFGHEAVRETHDSKTSIKINRFQLGAAHGYTDVRCWRCSLCIESATELFGQSDHRYVWRKKKKRKAKNTKPAMKYPGGSVIVVLYCTKGWRPAQNMTAS